MPLSIYQVHAVMVLPSTCVMLCPPVRQECSNGAISDAPFVAAWWSDGFQSLRSRVLPATRLIRAKFSVGFYPLSKNYSHCCIKLYHINVIS